MRFLLLLPLLTFGCNGGSTDGKETGDDTADTGDTGESGETGDSTVTTGGAIDSISVRLSTAVATVAIVSWTNDGTPDRVWIEYGSDTSYGKEAPSTSDTGGLILGETDGTTIHLRVGWEVGGTTEYSPDQTIQLGETVKGLPNYVVTDEDPSADFGNYILTSYYEVATGDAGLMILNRAGEVVWANAPQGGAIFAARPSRDGKALVYLWSESVNQVDNSRICRVSLDGETETCLDTPQAHHDFIELADGSYTYAKEEYSSFGSWDLTGDSLTNMTQDGTTTEIWNAFDDITPVEKSDWGSHVVNGRVDWTHVNGIWYDEAEDAYYPSFYFFEEIRKISGSTGRTEWVFGGEHNTFDRISGTDFGPQHAPQMTNGVMYMFDNGPQGRPSRVAGYEIDEARLEATEVVSWDHPGNMHAIVMGEAHMMESGYLASSWGDIGDMIIWSPEGEPVWTWNPDPANTAAQVYAYDDLYNLAH